MILMKEDDASISLSKEKKSRFFIVYSLVFFMSLLWIGSLTYNFNFFWEDSSYSPYFEPESGRTASGIILQMVKIVFSPQSIFFSISYRSRPLNDMYFVFFSTTLNIFFFVFLLLK